MKWPKPSRPFRSLVALGALACGSAERATEPLEIDVQPGVAIHDAGDSVTLTDQSSLIAAPDGGFLVVRTAGRGQLAFYDSSGRLTGTYGRKGRGPGEFSSISGVAFGPGDSLFIGDYENRRISVLAPGDHHIVRAELAAGGDASFREMPGGRLSAPVVIGRPGGRQSFGYRLAPWNGSAARTFGSSIPFERIGSAGVTTDGKLWIADALVYELALFDGDREVRRVRRDVDWFPRDTSPITAPRWMGKGRPFVAGISVDAADRLWVLIKRKNPNYTGAARAQAPKAPINPRGLPALAEIFESVLEVLDSNTGALIDSRVLPGDVLGFISPGRLFQRTDADSTGALKLQVWNVRLRERR